MRLWPASTIRSVLALELGAQVSVFQHIVHGSVSPEIIAVDFALAHSIYGRDRLLDMNCSRHEYAALYASSSTAAVASGVWLADHEMLPAAALCMLLHAGYKPSKPFIAPIKPFFIAACWSYLVCIVPDPSIDHFSMLSYATLMSGASHVADIRDVKDDILNSIRTPAVLLDEYAPLLSVAMAIASIILRHFTISYGPEDAFLDASAVGVAYISALNITQ